MIQARIPAAEILAKLAIITSSHYDRFTVAHVSVATFAYLPTFRQRFPYQGSRLLRVPYSSPVALHSSWQQYFKRRKRTTPAKSCASNRRNGVYSSLFCVKGSGGHSKARETRDAQFMQKFVGFALIGVTPARPQVCKCPPPQIPVSSVAIFMSRRHWAYKTKLTNVRDRMLQLQSNRAPLLSYEDLPRLTKFFEALRVFPRQNRWTTKNKMKRLIDVSRDVDLPVVWIACYPGHRRFTRRANLHSRLVA